MSGEEKQIFKKCPMCSQVWETREIFLRDQTLKINGYGADFRSLGRSLFYFTHNVAHCSSTLTIQAEKFFDLYSGKKYSERRTGEKECPGFCVEKDQLNRCDAFCECAFNREIIQIIKNNYRS